MEIYYKWRVYRNSKMKDEIKKIGVLRHKKSAEYWNTHDKGFKKFEWTQDTKLVRDVKHKQKVF